MISDARGPADEKVSGGDTPPRIDTVAARLAEPLERLRGETSTAYARLRQKKGQDFFDPAVKKREAEEVASKRAFNTPLSDCAGIRRLARAICHVACHGAEVLPEETPNLWRLIAGKHDPIHHFHHLRHPENAADHADLAGFTGAWRVVHRRSDGLGFMVWTMTVTDDPASPLAWFSMETRLGERTVGVDGGLHRMGSVVQFEGCDRDGDPTPMEMKVVMNGAVRRGPQFDFANGILTRIRIVPIAAHFIMRRIGDSSSWSGHVIPSDQGNAAGCPDEVLADIRLLTDNDPVVIRAPHIGEGP